MLIQPKEGVVLPERRPLDSYITPRATVDQMLDLVQGTPRSVLDPCAGPGVFGQAARVRWPAAHISGVEINQELPAHPDYQYWDRCDFLAVRFRERFDLVISNPPYSNGAAEAFVRRGLSFLGFGGVLVYLLRLTFLEGKARATGLFREFPPEQILVLGRVNFIDCGMGSPHAQCAIVWRQGWQGETRVTWPNWGNAK